jgi:uncharacterized protein YodC (DUF2158 family)
MENTEEIKPGDVVQLKSGSVSMTVAAMLNDETAQVFYWLDAIDDGRSELCNSDIPVMALTKVTP